MPNYLMYTQGRDTEAGKFGGLRYSMPNAPLVVTYRWQMTLARFHQSMWN